MALALIWIAPVSTAVGQVSLIAAQAAESTKEAEIKKPDRPESVLGSNPRELVSSFLEAVSENRYLEAASLFDSRSVIFSAKDADYKYQAPRYVQKLSEIFQNLPKFELESLSNKSDSPPVRIKTSDHSSPIIMAPNPNGQWRFTPETVDSIPQIYTHLREIEALRRSQFFRPFFPSMLINGTFIIPYYQWICLAIVLILGFFVDHLLRYLMGWITVRWFRRNQIDVDLIEERALWKPLGLLAMALFWYLGMEVIGLPPSAMDVLLLAVRFFAIVTAVWTAFLLINIATHAWSRKAEKTETRFDDLLIPLVSRSLKILAVCVGVVVFAEAFDLPLAGILGGMGIGGVAIAFAAKDAVANLFGSVTVLLDRPFEIGDWIKTDKIEGSVEQVGIRSTRVRTFYNSLVTLPNSLLTTAVVDNMGKRKSRRFKTFISLEYDTSPARIEAFCEGVRELLRRHPLVMQDNFHVYLNQMSASSLDVLLYCFFNCPDWAAELKTRQRLLLDILRLTERLEVGLAFPTQTVHVWQRGQDPPGPTGQIDQSPENFGAKAASELSDR
jgi:MscS family membrane protein